MAAFTFPTMHLPQEAQWPLAVVRTPILSMSELRPPRRSSIASFFFGFGDDDDEVSRAAPSSLLSFTLLLSFFWTRGGGAEAGAEAGADPGADAGADADPVSGTCQKRNKASQKMLSDLLSILIFFVDCPVKFVQIWDDKTVMPSADEMLELPEKY